MKRFKLQIAGLFLLTLFNSCSQPPPSVAKPHRRPDISSPAASSESQTVIIKLKPGIDYKLKQGRPVFGIPSLDSLVQHYQVIRLKRKFRINTALSGQDSTGLNRVFEMHYQKAVKPSRAAKAFNANPSIEYAEPLPDLQLH